MLKMPPTKGRWELGDLGAGRDGDTDSCADVCVAGEVAAAEPIWTIALAGLGLNHLNTWLVVDMRGYWHGYALILIVKLVPLMTYFLSRFWVFGR